MSSSNNYSDNTRLQSNGYYDPYYQYQPNYHPVKEESHKNFVYPSGSVTYTTNPNGNTALSGTNTPNTSTPTVATTNNVTPTAATSTVATTAPASSTSTTAATSASNATITPNNNNTIAPNPVQGVPIHWPYSVPVMRTDRSMIPGLVPQLKSRITTTFWEDENTVCYQVEARGISVSRREDTNFINGTKLLNVTGMTRGRRDGILKTEKTRYVVKIGAMNLKGVWIPFERAYELARNEGIADSLHPLFVRDIKTYYMSGINSNNNNTAITAPTTTATEQNTETTEQTNSTTSTPSAATYQTPVNMANVQQMYLYQQQQVAAAVAVAANDPEASHSSSTTNPPLQPNQMMYQYAPQYYGYGQYANGYPVTNNPQYLYYSGYQKNQSSYVDNQSITKKESK